MAVKAGNVQGINFLTEFAGSEKGGVAIVTFDLIATALTGSTDTVTLGGAGQDDRIATTSTLQQIMQNRRRDGKTVTITGVAGCVAPGYQGATVIYPQAAVVAGGNVTSITLNNAATGGAVVNTTVASWDRPAVIALTYTAV